MKNKEVLGYICITDCTDLHLGAKDVIIYPTIVSLKKAKSCWMECGIIEVVTGATVKKPMSIQQIIKRARKRETI